MKRVKRQLTVGIVLSSYEESYPHELREGLYAAARQYDVQLIFFIGKNLCSPDQWQQNITYFLSGPARLDGFIIATGAIGYFCLHQAVEELCNSFSPLPVVGIGTKFPGVPTIRARNKEGMRDLITHLVKDHGYRRIAYIRGPEHGQESEERYAGFCEVLHEYGVEQDPNLILPGDFSFRSGVTAIGIMLDERRLSNLDVLVGSNDAAIYGALYELERRGLSVPGDIKVAGFDNAEGIEYQSVALTTVSQNIYQQGFSAIEILLDLINGQEAPEDIRVPTKLEIRESCGCLPGDGFALLHNIPSVQRARAQAQVNIGETEFQSNKEMILKTKWRPETGNNEGLNLYRFLQEAIEEDIRSRGETDHFVQAVYSLIDDLPKKIGNTKKILVFQDLLWVISRQLAFRFPKDLPNYLLEEVQKAQVQIGKALFREEVYHYNRTEIVLDCLRRFNSHTNSAFTEIDELMEYIIAEMSSLGVMNCFISLYQSEVKGDNDQGWQVPEFSRLIMAYRQGTAIPLKADNVFPTHLLIPDFLYPYDLEYPLVVMALVSRDKHFGFIVFEDRFNHNMVFDMVREQISNSLYTFFLYKELQDLSVKDDLTGLYNRRGLFFRGKDLFEQTKIERRSYYVFFADMDGLKQINDHYGHKEGDFAIQRAAEALTEFFPGDAVVARLGGDEFVVIVSASRITDQKKITGDFARKMAEINRRIGAAKPYRISMSIGFSSFDPDHPRTFDELLDEADQKLYLDKARKQKASRWIRRRKM